MPSTLEIRRPLLQTVFGIVGWLVASTAMSAAPIDFNREVRPIFSEHCYACHGPDENKRKAGLRLDVYEEAIKSLKSGNRAIVPSDLTKSALIQRIMATDPEEIMPPVKHAKPLSAAQVEVLKRWVQEGAPWKVHWSFLVPERPPLP